MAQAVESLPSKFKALSSNEREGGRKGGRVGGKEGRKEGRKEGSNLYNLNHQDFCLWYSKCCMIHSVNMYKEKIPQC
jgi:hypothetical protein